MGGPGGGGQIMPSMTAFASFLKRGKVWVMDLKIRLTSSNKTSNSTQTLFSARVTPRCTYVT